MGSNEGKMRGGRCGAMRGGRWMGALRGQVGGEQ